MKANDYILFSADDLNFCVAATAVHCIHDGLLTQNEVGTEPWFEGLAVVEGRLLPVTDVGAFYGRKSSTGRVLEVAHSLGVAGLRVDDVHGVSNEYDEDAYQFIDIAQLLQSAKFLDIQAQTA